MLALGHLLWHSCEILVAILQDILRRSIIYKKTLPISSLCYSVWRYVEKNGPCEYFCYTLILLAILPLQTLPYQNRVVGIFFPLHAWLPFRIQNGRVKQFFYRDKKKIKLKSMSSCLSDYKDSKNVWFSICPMFGTGVMGQNLKRSSTFALFLVKNDLE